MALVLLEGGDGDQRSTLLSPSASPLVPLRRRHPLPASQCQRKSQGAKDGGHQVCVRQRKEKGTQECRFVLERDHDYHEDGGGVSLVALKSAS